MKKILYRLGTMLGCAAVCACSMVRTLESESGLYDVKLERHAKVIMDGTWAWGGGNPYAHLKQGAIYFSPLDISKVVEEQPKLAPLMVPQMFEYVVQETLQELKRVNAANGSNWTVTANPQDATVRVDMALVHFRPQRPFLRVLSSIGGKFVKVPGVSDAVGSFAKGDICIEMTVRDGKTGKLYFACKDSNSKTARLISADAYSKSGNADVNLRFWAQRIALMIRVCSQDKTGRRTLREYIEERSWGELLKERYIN